MGEGGVRQFVMSNFWRFEGVRIVDSTIHRGLYVKSAVTHVLGRALNLSYVRQQCFTAKSS